MSPVSALAVPIMNTTPTDPPFSHRPRSALFAARCMARRLHTCCSRDARRAASLPARSPLPSPAAVSPQPQVAGSRGRATEPAAPHVAAPRRRFRSARRPRTQPAARGIARTCVCNRSTPSRSRSRTRPPCPPRRGSGRPGTAPERPALGRPARHATPTRAHGHTTPLPRPSRRRPPQNPPVARRRGHRSA